MTQDTRLLTDDRNRLGTGHGEPFDPEAVVDENLPFMRDLAKAMFGAVRHAVAETGLYRKCPRRLCRREGRCERFGERFSDPCCETELTEEAMRIANRVFDAFQRDVFREEHEMERRSKRGVDSRKGGAAT